jgi:hypothetical protein
MHVAKEVCFGKFKQNGTRWQIDWDVALDQMKDFPTGEELENEFGCSYADLVYRWIEGRNAPILKFVYQYGWTAWPNVRVHLNARDVETKKKKE